MSVAIIRKPRRGPAYASLRDYTGDYGETQKMAPAAKIKRQSRNKMARQSRRENRSQRRSG